MKKIKYPNKFFDYSSGVDLNNVKINDMIQEGIDLMKRQAKEKKKHLMFYISTGNTIVWGYGHKVKKRKFEIEINVSKNYQTFNQHINLIEKGS